MGSNLVQGQITLAYETLGKISKIVSEFLDETTITSLKNEQAEEEKEGFYADLLVSIRRINVLR
ncbi:DUF3907 family protein [Anaerobacillus sp. HL2]|nr:DUF3907 family protein [Anaerobacillus sp. HL2]